MQKIKVASMEESLHKVQSKVRKLSPKESNSNLFTGEYSFCARSNKRSNTSV